MNDNILNEAFKKSISDPAINVAQNISEVGLDKLIDNEVVKSIPFISTVISVYKIGRSVSELHHVKQLIRFIEATNNNMNTEEREKVLNEFNSKSLEERNKELEYIILLSSKYLNEDKPELLSKLYISYLKGKIDWTHFVACSEVIDRLLPDDIDCLIVGDYKNVVDNEVSDSLLRMLSLGLYRSVVNNDCLDCKDYLLTSFGNIFRVCLELDTREQQEFLLSKTINKLNDRFQRK